MRVGLVLKCVKCARGRTFDLSTKAPGKGAENRAENLTCSPVVVASLRGAGDRGL